MKKTKVFVHQDDTTYHSSIGTKAKTHFKCLPCSPYLPDLAPSDFYLKRILAGNIFGLDEEVIALKRNYVDV